MALPRVPKMTLGQAFVNDTPRNLLVIMLILMLCMPIGLICNLIVAV